MLMRLSKNTFVRQFGPFTYVLGRIQSFDQMFTDAEPFFRWIGREPREKVEILANIRGVYEDADAARIAADFDEFFAPLAAAKIVLCGETPAELDGQEESFSYDADDPKTMDIRRIDPEKTAEGPVPQEVLEKWFAKHPAIFDLHMDLTQACTERCIHCYIPEYKPVFLPLADAKRVIDEFRAQGGVGLSLSGGECMLHPDFDEIVRYAREKDLIVGVLSNLTLCDDAKVRLLREAEASVQVSLYSMDPATHDAITKRPGSFLATKTAIEKLRAAHVPCRISCPTMKGNYRDYLAVLAYARSLRMDAQTDFVIMGKQNGDTSNLACRLDLGETRSILEDIVFRSVPMQSEYFDPSKKEEMLPSEEWKKRKVCGACVSSICLEATGDYYPCPGFGGIVLGNCHEHDLKWVWEQSPETRRIRGVTGADFPKCQHCKDRDYCSVCMCRNFNETGDLFKPAEHFCRVAALNHEIVDEKQRQMMAEAGRIRLKSGGVARKTDWHVHIGRFGGVNYPAERVFAALMANGTDEAWFSSMTSGEGVAPAGSGQGESAPEKTYRAIRREVLDALETARQIGFKAHALYWVMPEVHLAEDAPVDITTAMSETPYEGFKLHPGGNPWNLNNPKTAQLAEEVFAYAEKHGLLVLVHCGQNAEELPTKFETLVARHSKVTVQLAHCRPVKETLYMLEKYPNTVCDTAFAGEKTQEIIRAAGFGKRIRFGTDFPVTQYFAAQRAMRCRYPLETQGGMRDNSDSMTNERIQR